MSIASVMPSNYLNLCSPLLLMLARVQPTRPPPARFSATVHAEDAPMMGTGSGVEDT